MVGCVMHGTSVCPESLGSGHVVQLFDDVESRAATVAAYLHSGWTRGQGLLAAVRPDTWAAVSRNLIDLGCDVNAAATSPRVVVLDAATTLAAVVRNGHPMAERFHALVVPVLDRLSSNGRQPVCVYGELVDVLAAEGELECALRLEHLWNELAARFPMTLLCGYSSGNFGDPAAAPMLRHICDAHQGVASNPDDLLGTWLVARSAGNPVTAQ
jgi:hypothetical protein